MLSVYHFWEEDHILRILEQSQTCEERTGVSLKDENAEYL